MIVSDAQSIVNDLVVIYVRRTKHTFGHNYCAVCLVIVNSISAANYHEYIHWYEVLGQQTEKEYRQENCHWFHKGKQPNYVYIGEDKIHSMFTVITSFGVLNPSRRKRHKPYRPWQQKQREAQQPNKCVITVQSEIHLFYGKDWQWHSHMHTIYSSTQNDKTA